MNNLKNALLWLGAVALVLVVQVAGVRAQSHGSIEAARNKLVDEAVVEAGVKNKDVIQAMRDTPRHEFTPLNQRKLAYYDMALPIGDGQTISPPYVVAFMTEALDPKKTDKVLEIGTGSGYQAAVLAKLVKDVYTIEIVPTLGNKAAKTLERLHYDNVHVKVGDGYQGWPEHAPFDKIIVTCSPEKVPPELVKQLKEGGRMVIPVGERYQQVLYLMKKVNGKMESENLQATLFVPMTGKAEAQRQVKPDPTKPVLENGNFEKAEGDPLRPSGWHYQRLLEVEGENAAEGKQCVHFKNGTPGREATALQGFAIDGRKVPYLQVTCHVKGKDIRPGQSERQLPTIVISYFDENRAPAGIETVGQWRGTFDWQRESRMTKVPLKAREAILRIGLLGATGDLWMDDVQVRAAKR